MGVTSLRPLVRLTLLLAELAVAAYPASSLLAVLLRSLFLGRASHLDAFSGYPFRT